MTRLFVFVVGFYAALLPFRSGAQSLSTNNVTFNFTTFGLQSNAVTRVTVQARYWMAVPGSFYVNPPQVLTRATYPAMTNGSVTFSNQLCGVPYQVTFGGYRDWTTNYFIPATAATNGTVDAASYVGQYTSPTAFYYAYVSGFNFSTNYTLIWQTNVYNITNDLSSANTNALDAAQQAILNGAITNIIGTNGVVAITNGAGVVTLSLYVAPAIATFINNQNSIEQGATVTSTILDWTLSGGAITSQSIDQGIGSLSTALRTKTHTESYTTARTYTLTISDGTTTPTAATTITFYNKAYWGSSTNTSLTDGQIIALTGSEFATSRLRTKSITTANEYIYFAWPATFGAATFVVDGFSDDGWTLTTNTFVNASGYSSSYITSRHTLLTTGAYSVTAN